MMAEPVLTDTHRYIRFLEATSTKAGTLHPSTTFLELRLGQRCLDIGCGRRESGGGASATWSSRGGRAQGDPPRCGGGRNPRPGRPGDGASTHFDSALECCDGLIA